MLLMMFPSFGFAIAYQPIAGINFGAKIIDRVGDGFKKFVYTSTASIIIPWALVMFFPATVIGWMLPDSILSGEDIFNFRIFISTLFLFPAFFMGTTLFQATGKAKLAGGITIFRDLLLFLPFTIILPMFLGVSGVYYVNIPVNIIIIVLIIWVVNRQFKIWRAEIR